MSSTASTPSTVAARPAALRDASRELVRVVPASADRAGEWDAYVQSHPLGSLFHTFAWRGAVESAFGHEPACLMAMRGATVRGLLPLFVVRSLLAGRLLISVPYAVEGGILASDDIAALALFDAASRIATHRRCSTIELRSRRTAVHGLEPVDGYVGFERELPADPDDVWTWLPRKARAAARNAQNKYGVEVRLGDEQLPLVWKLYTRAMRRLASLNYPYPFFRELVERTPGGHFTAVAYRNGAAVAGLLTFLHKDRVLPYFFGATSEARRCSAANYLYLRTMQLGVEEGFRVYDFGRSRRDNAGSYEFKRLHGFEPTPLEYRRLVVSGRPPTELRPDNPKFRLARRVWPHLPLALTRPLGAALSRHVPG